MVGGNSVSIQLSCVLERAASVPASRRPPACPRPSPAVRDIPTSRPGLTPEEAGGWALNPHIWYPLYQPLEAWRLLAGCGAELSALPGFRYDLTDLGRNVLSKHATQVRARVGLVG